ncbi:MAG TPA: hypothetical protein VGA55_02160 [Bacteroidota bacterium]
MQRTINYVLDTTQYFNAEACLRADLFDYRWWSIHFGRQARSNAEFAEHYQGPVLAN